MSTRSLRRTGRQLTVISSAWLPMMKHPSWIGQSSFPSQSPVVHSSKVEGNQSGKEIGYSTKASRVFGGYPGQVFLARSSYPLPA